MLVLRRLLAAGSAFGALIGAAAVWVASRPRPDLDQPTVPDPPPGLPPARIVAVPGHGELFVREAGPVDGPVIVLLHGWIYPADLTWWTCYGPLAANARVIALDYRGHGRGPRPAKPFRLADAADDVAALLRHLDVAPAVAVGYSMGGPVAQLLWQRHPNVVRGLVLCATSSTWIASPRMRWGWRLIGIFQVLLRVIPRHWWERLYYAQATGQLPVPISQMINPDTPRELLQLLPWIIAELDRGSAEDVAEAGRELSRYDARGWLPTVDVPTAVLVTIRDSLVPVDHQRDLVARIPSARTFDVDGDHDVVIAQPEVFVPQLLAAVRAVLDAS